MLEHKINKAAYLHIFHFSNLGVFKQFPGFLSRQSLYS